MKREKYCYTMRGLIEDEKKHLNSLRDEENWDKILNHWSQWYGKDLLNTTEETYEIMVKTKHPFIYSIHTTCQLCDKFFELDNEFIFLLIEVDEDYQIELTAHKTCIKSLSELS